MNDMRNGLVQRTISMRSSTIKVVATQNQGSLEDKKKKEQVTTELEVVL